MAYYLTCLDVAVRADTFDNQCCLEVLPAYARQMRESLDSFWGVHDLIKGCRGLNKDLS